MSKKVKVAQKELDDIYSPTKFYNYGDNPALQKFIEVTQQNHFEGKQIDHRTYVVDNRKKFFWARNFDDFLQRDLKAFNFVRAFSVWTGMSCLAFIATLHQRRFFPVGSRGISSFRQTSFYFNFGPVGVVGFYAYFFGAWYLWWKSTKFTADKFYKHVILGERNWIYEQQRQNPSYGLYYFKDDPLSCEENFPDLARGEMAKYKWPVPEWKQ